MSYLLTSYVANKEGNCKYVRKKNNNAIIAKFVYLWKSRM